MIQATRLVLLATLVCFCCAGVQGAQIAFDSAGDSAYNNGWTQGSNGGFGWGAGWSFNLPFAQPIIGDSTTNGSGGPDGTGDINSPRASGGRAWGLISGGATRAFSGPLSVGQTFSIDFDDYGGSGMNFVSSVSLLAPAGAEVIGLWANIGLDYQIRTADLNLIDTGVPETDQGIHIAFTELSAGVQVSITPYVTGTTTTIITPYTGQLAGVEFDANNFPITPFPPQLIPYINNMAITPEPAGLGLLVTTMSALAARRRRR